MTWYHVFLEFPNGQLKELRNTSVVTGRWYAANPTDAMANARNRYNIQDLSPLVAIPQHRLHRTPVPVTFARPYNT